MSMTFATDVVVNGSYSLQGKTFKAPSTSGGSTYGVGTNGQVLKSNGTSSYWGDAGGGSLMPSTAFSIPSEGNSVSYDMDGMTADYRLVMWQFSASAENRPPADLSWTTYSGYFTITNNGGTTDETIQPVFELPASVLISEHVSE